MGTGKFRHYGADPVWTYGPEPDEEDTFDTLEQVRDYTIREHPWTAPYLMDLEVWNWLKDYRAYVCWNEHGNEPSLREIAEDGYFASDVIDLVEEIDPYKTRYLTVDGDYGSMGSEEIDLLDRRATIQRKHGLDPDWKGMPGKGSASKRGGLKASKLRAIFCPVKTKLSVKSKGRH